MSQTGRHWVNITRPVYKTSQHLVSSTFYSAGLPQYHRVHHHHRPAHATSEGAAKSRLAHIYTLCDNIRFYHRDSDTGTMCLYVVAVWQGCNHKEWLGSAHCGIDPYDPKHRSSTDYYEESGFDCHLCLLRRGEFIDPYDVRYYPATDLNVTIIKENGIGKIIPCAFDGPGESLRPRAGNKMMAVRYGNGDSGGIDERKYKISPALNTPPLHCLFSIPSPNLTALANFATSTNSKGNSRAEQTPAKMSSDTAKHRNLINAQLQQLPKPTSAPDNTTQAETHRQLVNEQLKVLPTHVQATQNQPNPYTYGGWLPPSPKNPWGLPVLCADAFTPGPSVTQPPRVPSPRLKGPQLGQWYTNPTKHQG
ncbi:hypothetical protein BDV96DRAFT_177035 [Lophiotrema nucula]|uniref:Uncharacterized protein n=1 Tax=Lophiotrema nucula TaxID=690887 RepID=A0A6A5YXX6_9PLEO|nr:hypothetical protein BDV96DRAFT_177035 [Lophiotrema nucula]